MDSADDLDALHMPTSVKWGGGAAMVAGVFTLGLALQTALVFELVGAIAPVALVSMIALGFAALASGWRMMRAGGNVAFAATACSAVLTMASAAWAIFSLSRGVVSLLSFGVPILAMGATVVAGLAIRAARRVGAAHARLARQGLAIQATGPVTRFLARPIVAGALAAAVLCGVVGIVLWKRAHRTFDPLATPPGALLGQKLTDYLVAHGEEKTAIHRELTGDASRKVLGPEVATALGTLLDRAEALERVSGDPTAAVDGLLLSASSLEDALRASNLPMFVDVDVLSGRERLQPLLLSYYVEREASYDAGGTVVRTLHLWRMDRLRVSLPFLGYTRPRTSSALVLLDTIETDLVTGIVPALEPGERFQLVPDDGRDPPKWTETLEQKAGERARAELGAEASDPRFERLAALLARRRTLVRKWAATLPQLGLILRVPERYVPEAKYEDELAHRMPRRDLDEWRDLHEELMMPAMLDAFVALRRRVVGSVERHEIQHRLDYATGLLAVPPDVCLLLGVDNPLGVAATSMPGRARDELSAYLAQIGTGGTPVLDLLLLSRALFQDGADAYTYAAWAALIGIGRELGLDESALTAARVRPEQFALALEAVIDKPPAAIAAAALRVRRAAYGNDVPEVRLLSAVDHATWRR